MEAQNLTGARQPSMSDGLSSATAAKAMLCVCHRKEPAPAPVLRGAEDHCALGWGLAYLGFPRGRAGAVLLGVTPGMCTGRASPCACLSSCSWTEQAPGLARWIRSIGRAPQNA